MGNIFSKKEEEDIFQMFYGIITKDFVIAEELCKTEIKSIKNQVKNAKHNSQSYSKIAKEIQSDKKRIAKRKLFNAFTNYRKSFEDVSLITKHNFENDIQTLNNHLQLFEDIYKSFKRGIRDQSESTLKQYKTDRLALKNKKTMFEKIEADYKKMHTDYNHAVNKYRNSLTDTKATDAIRSKLEFSAHKIHDSLDTLEKNYVEAAEIFNDVSDEYYKKKMPGYLNALRCLHTNYSAILNDFVKECKTIQNQLFSNKQAMASELREIKKSELTDNQDSIMITELLNQEEFKTLTTLIVNLHPDINLTTGDKINIPSPNDIPTEVCKIPKVELTSLRTTLAIKHSATDKY